MQEAIEEEYEAITPEIIKWLSNLSDSFYKCWICGEPHDGDNLKAALFIPKKDHAILNITGNAKGDLVRYFPYLICDICIEKDLVEREMILEEMTIKYWCPENN